MYNCLEVGIRHRLLTFEPLFCSESSWATQTCTHTRVWGRWWWWWSWWRKRLLHYYTNQCFRITTTTAAAATASEDIGSTRLIHGKYLTNLYLFPLRLHSLVLVVVIIIMRRHYLSPHHRWSFKELQTDSCVKLLHQKSTTLDNLSTLNTTNFFLEKHRLARQHRKELSIWPTIAPSKFQNQSISSFLSSFYLICVILAHTIRKLK